MIALIQRVTEASVSANGETVGRIGPGLLALIGILPDDGERSVLRMLDRLLGFRVFADPEGRMNLCLQDIEGGLLLVPQFTLTADTKKGMRPSLSSAAPPGLAQCLFEQLVAEARRAWPIVSSGIFGAEMRVSLVNHGPVTFWIEA